MSEIEPGVFCARRGERAPLALERMCNAFGEEQAGEGLGTRANRGGRAFGEELSAVDAGCRAEVDDAIGSRHEFIVVLDDEERVSFVAKGEQGLDEAVVVAGVEADAGFVEDVENTGEIGAELRGKADALSFAARERLRGAFEREVAEADVIEKF